MSHIATTRIDALLFIIDFWQGSINASQLRYWYSRCKRKVSFNIRIEAMKELLN